MFNKIKCLSQHKKVKYFIDKYGSISRDDGYISRRLGKIQSSSRLMPPSLALSLGGLSIAPEEELLGLVEDETLPNG